MKTEWDEYEVFLETWPPSEILQHATLESNLHDPLTGARLIADVSGEAELARTEFVPGYKTIAADERALRKYEFFEVRQAEWSAHFRDYVLGAGVDEGRFDQFVHAFAHIWVDGKARRQGSPEMMSIKASIRDHDRRFHPKYAGHFVRERIAGMIEPLLSFREMEVILRANERLIESFAPDYLRALEGEYRGSINRLVVRRGVHMPTLPEELREELHYLSSYSLALGPAEQFAQTWSDATKNNGVPCIFSAPLPALQNRVVAFAPFIAGMDLQQLELVVAPPIEECRLLPRGAYGGIHDYEFD